MFKFLQISPSTSYSYSDEGIEEVDNKFYGECLWKCLNCEEIINLSINIDFKYCPFCGEQIEIVKQNIERKKYKKLYFDEVKFLFKFNCNHYILSHRDIKKRKYQKVIIVKSTPLNLP